MGFNLNPMWQNGSPWEGKLLLDSYGAIYICTHFHKMGKHINHNQTNHLKEGIFLGMLVIVGM
jgi:hypothetical protein